MFLGITWHEVMQKVLQLMVLESQAFSSKHLLEMILASHVGNPCPSSCWPASSQISLLALGARDWFQQGIGVAKLQQTGNYLHFCPDGNVVDVQYLPRGVCFLALLTTGALHFMLTTPLHDGDLALQDQRVSSGPDASHIHGGSTMPEAASNHPDDCSIDGLSPLETALVCEQAEIAKLLLRHQASLGMVDFNAKSRHGDSIKTLAANMYHPASSELNAFFSCCTALRPQRRYYEVKGGASLPLNRFDCSLSKATLMNVDKGA